MRILIFNTFYYPKRVGGAEVSVQMLAEGLRAAGNEVFVVTFGKQWEVSRNNGVAVVRIKQLNVYSTWEEKERSPVQKAIWHLLDSFNFLNFFPVRKLLSRIKPDIVHTNNIQGFSPVIWAAVKQRKIPLVHTFRDYYMLCHKNNLYNGGSKCAELCSFCRLSHTIKKPFAKYPDFYTGISRFILDKHGRYLPLEKKKTGVVFNAVPVPPAPVPAKLAGDSRGKKLTLGFMGRISREKGAGYFAAELAKIKPELRDEFNVVFAGRGADSYLAGLQGELSGIQTEFPGMLQPGTFYEQVDVAVTPSLWEEPFGRVVIESLSYSVPVIMADSGGLSELYDPQCTWRFVPQENQLYPLLERLIENRHEIKQKARYCTDRAKSFSNDTTVQAYLAIYRELV